MVKRIPLTKGKYAIVDDEDFEWINQWKWHYSRALCSEQGYAKRSVYNKDTKKDNDVYMHKLVHPTDNGFQTDHINRDKLDNRRDNLRTVTRSQNIRNVGPKKNNKSGCPGVGWWANAWCAEIIINTNRIFLGRYKSKSDAVRVRKEAELKYFSL